MEIDRFVLGDFETNSFCVRQNAETKDCIVIDTGLSPQPLMEHLKANGYKPAAAIFTHGHVDHTAGIDLLRSNFPEIKIVIHKLDAEMLTDPTKNLSLMAGASMSTEPADIVIGDERSIEYADLTFEIIHTPGHTPGGICLYCKEENIAFVGDTIFAGSIGRTDFPGGNFDQLIAGIKEKLLILPDNTKLFCGHGPGTTIANEKKFNPFLS